MWMIERIKAGAARSSQRRAIEQLKREGRVGEPDPLPGGCVAYLVNGCQSMIAGAELVPLLDKACGDFAAGDVEGSKDLYDLAVNPERAQERADWLKEYADWAGLMVKLATTPVEFVPASDYVGGPINVPVAGQDQDLDSLIEGLQPIPRNPGAR